MRRITFLMCFMILGGAFFAYAAKDAPQHPMTIGGETCISCHAIDSNSENKAESPAHTQWLQSLHGINNVNCTTCHGDESNFRPASSINDCVSCHADQVAVIKRATKGNELVCMNCHAAHTFAVTPEKTPVHKK